jgi:hypothetical protein
MECCLQDRCLQDRGLLLSVWVVVVAGRDVRGGARQGDAVEAVADAIQRSR